ncbi:MAG: 16S rRNA processing protein RimM [Bacteroidetes bacterium]|nr:16S rRNA processing protein RimM [Bacteroidota bacterium]
MNKEECFYLGYTVKLHGYKGEISIKLDVDYPDDYKELESVFIEVNDQLIPFFITSIKVKDKGFAVVAFEGIKTIEQAESLISSSLYLPLSVLPALSGNKFYFHEIVGYALEDKVYGNIGFIKEVLDFPNQAVLQVFKDKKEILIPATDDIIIDVDRKTKTVYTNAPEGLIELYLL